MANNALQLLILINVRDVKTRKKSNHSLRSMRHQIYPLTEKYLRSLYAGRDQINYDAISCRGDPLVQILFEIRTTSLDKL